MNPIRFTNFTHSDISIPLPFQEMYVIESQCVLTADSSKVSSFPSSNCSREHWTCQRYRRVDHVPQVVNCNPINREND